MMKTLLVLISFTLTVTALGQPGNSSCRDEIRELCPNIERDREAMKQCVQDNLEKLSQGCRQAMEERRQKMEGQGRPRAGSS